MSLSDYGSKVFILDNKLWDKDIEDIDVSTETKLKIEKIKTEDFDCTLIDYHLPNAKGLEVIEQLREVDGKEITPKIRPKSSTENSLAIRIFVK